MRIYSLRYSKNIINFSLFISISIISSIIIIISLFWKKKKILVVYSVRNIEVKKFRRKDNIGMKNK